MPEEQRASEKSVQFNPDLMTYQCVNCGASLDGPGQCKFCGTNYKTLGQEVAADGIYIKITPDFPQRGMGGDIRNNELEEKIEQGFVDRIAKYYGTGDKDKKLFLHIFISSAQKHGASLWENYDPEKFDPVTYLAGEKHSISGNQSNIVRQLPELISKPEMWTTVATTLFAMGRQDLMSQKRELEIAFGFLVPLDQATNKGANLQGGELRSMVEKSKQERSVLSGIRNMFRFWRNRN